jgi:penicillin amidase
MLESLTQPFEEETPYERSRELLAGWDFLTSADKPDATIWWAWLNAFRDNVWKDEWQAAGLDLKEDSWGHTDLNKWQPPLEVLERMVADEPTSHWFDDVSTPGRETLKEIAGRSFVEAIDKLTSTYGPDVSTWHWGRVNRLRINHLSGNPVLSRGGQPMSGSDLTLSAKGNGSDVTGGPSWRMVVDFGALDEASGVYPGGQSGDPQNPHYDDLLDMWVKDKYIPLYFYPDAEQFPQKQVESILIFVAPSDSDEIFAP